MAKSFEDCLAEVVGDSVPDIHCSCPEHDRELLDIDYVFTVDIVQIPGLQNKDIADATLSNIIGFCFCPSARRWVEKIRFPDGGRYRVQKLTDLLDSAAKARQEKYGDAEPEVEEQEAQSQNVVAFPVPEPKEVEEVEVDSFDESDHGQNFSVPFEYDYFEPTDEKSKRRKQRKDKEGRRQAALA